ncbi:MAG: hypothetical protein HW405_409 [Candidatus Berkelbacteria bacterium]|nr:hypothetical protein [Candidatus Berkelbacteria bacterium]
MDYSVTLDPGSAAAAATATAAFGAIAIVWILFWIVVGGLGFVLWLWALIDCIRREFTNPNDKILWIVLILLLWLIGPILYLIIGRKKGTIPAAKSA